MHSAPNHKQGFDPGWGSVEHKMCTNKYKRKWMKGKSLSRPLKRRMDELKIVRPEQVKRFRSDRHFHYRIQT
jgi:hypothetical protein